MAKKKNVDVWSNYTLGIDNEVSEIEVNKESKTSENSDIQKFKNANVQTSENVEIQTNENVNIQKSIPEVNKNNLNKGKNGKKKLSYTDRGWQPITTYLSPRAKRKLAYQGYKEQRNLSEILDELILNNL